MMMYGVMDVTSDGALSALGDVVSWLSTQFAGVITTITSTPILLLSVGIFACGAVIGLAHRLIRG